MVPQDHCQRTMRHWWASLCDKRFVRHENAIQNAPCNRPLTHNSVFLQRFSTPLSIISKLCKHKSKKTIKKEKKVVVSNFDHFNIFDRFAHSDCDVLQLNFEHNRKTVNTFCSVTHLSVLSEPHRQQTPFPCNEIPSEFFLVKVCKHVSEDQNGGRHRVRSASIFQLSRAP
jgi:ribosomal protein S17E